MALPVIEAIDMLRATCVLLGVWGLLNAAQWIADARNMRDGSALGWDLQRLTQRRFHRSEITALLVGKRGITVIALAQALVSLSLVLLPIGHATVALLAALAISTLLQSQRLGADGGDKMALVAMAGAMLQAIGLALGNPVLVLAGVLWTGGQLAIAYFASGVTKMLIARWRNGEALAASLSSAMWGHSGLVHLVRSRNVALALAWVIMLAEAAFPLALLLPTNWLWAALAGFLLLHLAIARVMGLNLYVWGFFAAYPTAILLGQWLRGMLAIAGGSEGGT